MSRYSFSMPSHAGRQGWFRVGELEVTTTAIVCALSVASMFAFALSPALLEHLEYQPALVRSGELWRLATWPIANPPDIWAVVSIVVFWFVAHMVEDEVGRGRFLGLLAATTILPATLVAIVPLAADTASAAGIGVLGLAFIVVFALREPQAPSFFGIPIWILAAVFVGIQVLQMVGLRAWGYLFLMLGAIVVAAVGAAALGVLPRLSFVPQIGGARRADGPGTSSRRRSGGRRARGRGRGRGTVTAGPWEGTNPGPTRLEQAELDVLLDKISRSGIKSLTKEEQQRLDALSRKMRGS